MTDNLKALSEAATLIADIRKDREAGMDPRHGNWIWHGQPDGVSLATEYGGRRYVMDFVRKGMRGAQPRFQLGGLMHNAADDLVTFSVGDDHVRGHRQAKEDHSVYRYDISGIDHPDARRIARVPQMEDLIISLETQLTEAQAREAVAYEVAATEAERYAGNYKQGSDGRNTFVIFADAMRRKTAEKAQ